MGSQNKVIDLRMNGFPLQYSKDLSVKSKKCTFLSIFAEGLGLVIGESTKIRCAQDYTERMLQSRV